MPDIANPDARDDEDLLVKLTDDDGAGDKDKDKTKVETQKLDPVPGPGTQVTSPADGLKELEGQVISERQRAARAEETARAATVERDRAVAFARDQQARGISQQELAIDNNITSTNNDMTRISELMETAYGEGDFKKVAGYQLELNKLGGKLAVFERDKQIAQHNAARLKQQPQTRQPTEAQPTDPLEIAIKDRTPATQEFLRRHKELIRGDGTLKRSAIDAHEKALDAGHRVDTPEYFAHVETSLKGTAAEPVKVEGGFSAAPERGEPLGRQPVNGIQLSANGEFKMTPKYRRLAAEQGVSDTEWAKNYVKLLREGRMTPIPPN